MGQKQYEAGDFYVDSVGRRRKLSAGAMKDIRRMFYEGVSCVEIAEEYRVSPALIRTVCYNTARKRDLVRLGLDDVPPD